MRRVLRRHGDGGDRTASYRVSQGSPRASFTTGTSAGGLSTTAAGYKVGFAVSSSSILLNSGADATSDQFFGDMIFANNFRITEGRQYPNSLIWKNQLGREIMRIDETGAFSLPGMLQPVTAAFFNALMATTSAEKLTASSTPDSSAPWRGSFATAGAALKDALASLGSSIIRVFVEPIYAAVGIFDEVLAKFIHADRVETGELCVGATCVSSLQFQAMVAAAGQSHAAANTNHGEEPPPMSSSPADATNTPPVIRINGNNPAHIHVGDIYNDIGATITGPASDLNLGIHTFLNGTLVSDIVLDTSTTSTDTIDYVVTDQNGLTSTSTRTVIVEAAAAVDPPPSTEETLPPTEPTPPSPDTTATTTTTSTTATTTEATSTAQ